MANVHAQQNKPTQPKGPNGEKAKSAEPEAVKAPETKEVEAEELKLSHPKTPKELWLGVKDAQAGIDAAKQMVKEAEKVLSRACKEIYTTTGPGPYQVKGFGVVTIRFRPSNSPEYKTAEEKKSNGTYFLVQHEERTPQIVE